MKSKQHPVEKPMRHAGRIRRFLRANKAVSALEYAILIGVIAVGIGAALVAFENQIEAGLQKAGAKIANISGIG